jgi:hypothetical protein
MKREFLRTGSAVGAILSLEVRCALLELGEALDRVLRFDP